MTNLPASVLQTMNATPTYAIEENPRIAFRRELVSAGFRPPSVIAVGKLMRMDGPDDKKGRESGWAIYHESDKDGRLFGVGVFGSWKGNPERVVWCSRSTHAMSVQDREFYNAELETIRIKRDEALQQAQEDAAKRAFEIWSASDEGAHPYLERKQVDCADGIRVGKGNLIIPVYDSIRIISLQFIKEDGSKKFLTSGKIKGGWFRIPGDEELVYVCEGYATGMSIHMATGCAVYVAFNCGNLYEVATTIKSKYNRVIIAADDDDAGRTKANQAGTALGLEIMYPPHGFVDFNDYHVAEGMDALALHLVERPKLYKAKPSDTANYSTPPGMLGEIVSYYNITSGNSQPGFAIQTALAVGSLLCGRSFETNYDNRSALFLMNLGKSGTGKEHAKRVIERILESAACGDLFAGDGYTSKGGVFSALYEKPRHITVIDEFSKYMASSSNRFGNSNLNEANTELMKIIAAPNGIHRAPNYSMMGINKDKRKEVLDLKIVNPSVTLLAMSTPEDLLNNVSIGSVKDGFYNRFIVHISDSPRAVREHKEPLAVPENIVAWVKRLNMRRGNQPESPTDYPFMQTLVMSTEAMLVAREMEEYKVRRSNELERFSLAELPARMAEMAQRVALIVALGCDPMALVVEKEHMEWAVQWIKYNHIMLTNRLKMSVSSSEFEGRKLEALNAIREAGEAGISAREMVIRKPFSKYTSRELREIIEALVEAELIELRKRETGKAGKPIMAYMGME